MKSVFALVDCNSFYASCERVFRPDLIRTPIIVLSNNDGCVIARSAEVKQLGIPMGAPVFKYQPQIQQHGIQVFSANFPLYGDLSARVMDVLASLALDIEIYSIDEAFLRLPQVQNYTDYGQIIKDTVWRQVGIPVSVGIGSSKTLAKVASKIGKQHLEHHGVVNLTCLPREALDEVLDQISVSDVWGIGRAYSKYWYMHGVSTALDFKKLHRTVVWGKMKTPGLRTWQELHGVSAIPLAEQYRDKEHIMTSRSFGRPVTLLKELEEAITTYTTRGVEKLRRQRSTCRMIHVFLRTNRFKPAERQYAQTAYTVFPENTDYLPHLVTVAVAGLRRIFRAGLRYKKAGVLLSEIRPNQSWQGNLFTPLPHKARNRRLMGAFDTINQKFGRETVRLASSGSARPWQMRQEHLSPEYTTSWLDVPRVQA